MVSVCRCPRGHTWVLPAGAARTCPVCGDTALADDRTQSFAAPLTDRPTPPTAGEQTQYLGPPSELPATVDGLPAERRELSAVDLARPDCGVTVGQTPSPGERAADLSPQPPGTQLVPGYQILNEVGRGGMGVVYKAVQKSLNRSVALKMILSGEHAGPTERERFRREAAAVATLQHPNIVQIFEVGEASGHPYLVLEFVDGGSLAERLAGDPWPARDAAELVELLARAVHYAHEHGIVHRDLKPGNVLLNADRGPRGADSKTGSRDSGSDATFRTPSSAFVPKITDFGLAKRLDGSDADKATKTGAVVGTPGYIAPEQASGKGSEVGPPADVYALGAILYECLTGRPPFRGETPLDTVLQVMHDDPVPPRRLRSSVPRDLDTICLKCLTKSPAKRYPSAAALADDLRRFLHGEPIWARPLSAWGRGVKWATRHPALAVLGVSTVVATVALLVVLSVAYARVRDAVAQKEAEAQIAQREREAAETERARTQEQKELAERLAAEIELRRKEAVGQAEQLRREGERSKRAAYALQLAQIAAVCERDPTRALKLLDDDGRCPPELRDFTWEYLHRLCHREERVYAEHGPKAALAAVAYAPGGALVATAGRDGRVRLWDPRSGRTSAVLDGHFGPINGLAFGPDGRLLASAGADGTVRLWEIPVEVLETARKTMSAVPLLEQFVKPAQFRAILTVAVPNAGAATCVAFDPRGRTLAVGWADGRVRMWDAGALRPSPVEMAAAGGAAAVGRGRHPRARQPVVVFRAFEHGGEKVPVRCLAFDPTGRLLACGGDGGFAQVWSADQWSEAAALASHPIRGHAGAVLAVAFSPDGRLLATTNNPSPPAGPTIRLINTESWMDEHRLLGHTGAVTALAFSPDSTLLASAGADRSVRLWDAEDGNERSVLYGHSQPVGGVAFGPDRRSVVSAGRDGTARVWLTGVRTNDAAEVADAGGQVASAAVAAGVGMLVTAGESGRLGFRLIDAGPARAVTQSGSLFLWSLPIEPPRAAVRLTAVAPNGHVAFGAAADGILMWRVIQLRSRTPGAFGPGAMSVPRPSWLPTRKPVHALAATHDGRALAALDADGVRVWSLGLTPFGFDHPGKPPESRLILKAGNATAIAAHPWADVLVVGVGHGVRVMNLAGETVAELADAHQTRVTAVAFSPVGGFLATADADGLIQVWRLSPEGLALQSRLSGHAGPVHDLCFNPGGKTLASGGADRSVVLWDPVAGQERAVLTGHADQVIRVQFTADGAALVSVGRDGSVKRWRAEQRRPAPPPPAVLRW